MGLSPIVSEGIVSEETGDMVTENMVTSGGWWLRKTATTGRPWLGGKWIWKKSSLGGGGHRIGGR